ncbi:MAG: UDP-N-acetylmuramate dehydrogenase [Candidatus Sabulitectum sp.]|nr:UDP-N-acetylmuramate dehydrogenase [Candidatus Sabulitectum sp.]
MIFDKALNAAPDRFTVIQLSRYTTWEIGGPTASVIVNTLEELTETVKFVSENSLPWVILGKGSNTLAPTEGWHGVVILLSGELAKFSFNGSLLTAGGGVHLPSMSGAACSQGLTGLVFAVGIPGTVGGAVFMNAGAYGSSISELVEKVRVLHPCGSIEYLTAEDCGFGYRRSRFQKDDSIVLNVVLKLSENAGGGNELRREAREILQIRRQKFPLHAPNAGSVFRRPDNGSPPGKLIEDCGLKGHRLGGAMVSPTHANFIENTGNATSSDVMRLIELVADRVRQDSGITLKREIRRLGERI